MNPTLRYKEGYEYQVYEDYAIQTNIKPEAFILTGFIRLDTDGVLYVKAGYAWDGPSGPAIDTRNFMIGSLVHDALYQLMQEGHLDPAVYRKSADRELVRLTKNDGMSSFRRAWVYQGVRLGGGLAAQPDKGAILTAP